jgi:hypothetical protein
MAVRSSALRVGLAFFTPQGWFLVLIPVTHVVSHMRPQKQFRHLGAEPWNYKNRRWRIRGHTQGLSGPLTNRRMWRFQSRRIKAQDAKSEVLDDTACVLDACLSVPS